MPSLTRRSGCLEIDIAVTTVLPNWYYGSITIKLKFDQKRSPPAGRVPADGAALRSASPAQQLRAVCLEHLPAYFALEELPFLVGLDQAGTDQLFKVKRDGCLGHGKLLPQLLAGALLLRRDNFQERHSPGVRQGLGDELELRVGQLRPCSGGLFHSSMVIELSDFVKPFASETYLISGDNSRTSVTITTIPARSSTRP